LECDSGLDENITCMSMKDKLEKPSAEKERVFCIKIYMKMTKVTALFDPGSKNNLISEAFVQKLGLKTHKHPEPYPFG
jgi:hypothetical protein